MKILDLTTEEEGEITEENTLDKYQLSSPRTAIIRKKINNKKKKTEGCDDAKIDLCHIIHDMWEKYDRDPSTELDKNECREFIKNVIELLPECRRGFIPQHDDDALDNLFNKFDEQ